MTSLFRRLVSSGAGTGLIAVVALSITSQSQAADLKATAAQTLQAIAASAPVADIDPAIYHRWPT